MKTRMSPRYGKIQIFFSDFLAAHHQLWTVADAEYIGLRLW